MNLLRRRLAGLTIGNTLLIGGLCLAADQTYPFELLQDGTMQARVYSPDGENAYYRGVRFDRSGLIDSLQAGGHRFFGRFDEPHDPNNPIGVAGPANEFSTTAPPGFTEATTGGVFLKIGVGYLIKPDDKPYAFARDYKLADAGSWITHRISDAEVTFIQTLPPRGVLGCTFEKTLRINEAKNTLTITRSVTNTGSAVIDTDYYCHNFIQIDGLPVGPGYAVRFGFVPTFTARVRQKECIAADGQTIRITQPVGDVDHAVYAPIGGFGDGTTANFQVSNKNGAAVEITDSLPLTRITLYATGRALCPENFAKIVVPPGQTQRWSTVYHFVSAPPATEPRP